MVAPQKRAILLVFILLLFSALASADSFVYVVTRNLQFGTVDLNTGTFAQIGQNLPGGVAGLVPGPNGSLLTLGINGDLYSINPASGVTTLVGPTGLGDCSLPTSPCGLSSANILGELNGTIYATDFAENLYSVNPSNGQVTKIGPTGMPAVTFVPLSTPNPDGTFNFFGDGLLGANGSLYATFETGRVNFSTGAVTPVIPDNLYQIDPTTGLATLVPPTTFGTEPFVGVNGTFYGFNNALDEILTLNLSNGQTSFVTKLNSSAGLVFGATPTPEPRLLLLTGTGLVGLGLVLRRRIAAQRSSSTNAGQIAGFGLDMNTFEVHAFLATPTDGSEAGRCARRPTRPARLPENIRQLLQRRLY